MRSLVMALLLAGCGTKTVANKADHQLAEKQERTETVVAAKTETAAATTNTQTVNGRRVITTKPDGTVIDDTRWQLQIDLATFNYGGHATVVAAAAGKSEKQERDRNEATTTTRSRWWWPLDNAWWLVPALVIAFLLVRRFVWRGWPW
jgi:hypothetical protein